MNAPMTLSLSLLLTLLLTACSSAPKGPYGYTDRYQQALTSAPSGHPVDSGTIDRFIAFFNPLDASTIPAQIDTLYADPLYFNDTLVTLTERDQLAEHLQATAEGLNSMSLTVNHIIKDGSDVYLRWVMEARFSLLGSERLSRTIGISQLRFNAQGQVVFQQDFWDSSQGVDQHLPVIGPMTRWLREHD
ncbi:MAG TPA: nuclear transport factor 2 family protein [Alcanivorax sp.]|nr:nuclear transport factor 2 family protein [Alcanivorax sp.]